MSKSLIPALLALALMGCSYACNPTGAVGTYEMRSGPDAYQIRLLQDGAGALARNGKQFETFTWEIEPSNGQVFVHILRESIEVLDSLDGKQKSLSGAPKGESGYSGLMPSCGPSGRANRLELDVDGQRYFSRTD